MCHADRYNNLQKKTKKVGGDCVRTYYVVHTVSFEIVTFCARGRGTRIFVGLGVGTKYEKEIRIVYFPFVSTYCEQPVGERFDTLRSQKGCYVRSYGDVAATGYRRRT